MKLIATDYDGTLNYNGVGKETVEAKYGEQEVIAIGDELNDVAMLQAYHSYAMRHGNPMLAKFVNGMVDSVTEVIWKEL